MKRAKVHAFLLCVFQLSIINYKLSKTENAENPKKSRLFDFLYIMKSIWLCQLPLKKGLWDNDYLFYDDGTIEHEYDLSVKKLNLISKIQPNEIDEFDRLAIINRINECPERWRTFVLSILNTQNKVL